jgi:hypothetical protein
MVSMGPNATNINMIKDSNFQSRTITLVYIKLLWKFIWTHRITAGRPPPHMVDVEVFDNFQSLFNQSGHKQR